MPNHDAIPAVRSVALGGYFQKLCRWSESHNLSPSVRGVNIQVVGGVTRRGLLTQQDLVLDGVCRAARIAN